MRKGTVIALALAALALAACGGDDNTELDLAAFEECFEGQSTDLTVVDEVDLIAEQAGVGAVALLERVDPSTIKPKGLNAQLGALGEALAEDRAQRQSDNQEIQVVGERTSGDADNTASQYESRGQVEQYGTVVLAAKKTMIDEELDPIKTCLSEQGID